MSIFVAGLDLGQAQDYSALVIIEAQGTTRKVFYEDAHPLLNVPMTAWAMVEGLPLTRLDVRHL